MFNRHCHRWRIVSVSHRQPDLSAIKGEGFNAGDLLKEMRAGTTHVLLRCSGCGELNSYSALGIHNLKVEEID